MELQEEYLEINSGCTPESPDQSKSESSQNDSSSEKILSYLLKKSSTPLIHHKEVFRNLWVFWSKNEGSENISSSADLHDKIKYAFEAIDLYFAELVAQLWAPVTISSGRRLLSTSGQPFAIGKLSKELVDYRLYSEKYYFDVDVNKINFQDDHNIKSGGPATAFLNRLPYIIDPLESENCCSGLKFRFMLPICFHPQSDCIAVLEITANYNILKFVLYYVQDAVKRAGLHVCNVQEHISYKMQAINDLSPAKDEIKRALEIVCKSHQIRLAQVWIPFEDKSHVPLSSNSEDTLLGLKWADYHHNYFWDISGLLIFIMYASFCQHFTFKTRKQHALKTLEDFKPRYISELCDDFLVNWNDLSGDYCAFAICLRSLHTGDLSFAFEFIWRKHSRCVGLLEDILSTIKMRFPSFKLASGGELGDELDVIEVGCSEYGQNKNFKIFQGKRPSPTPMALEKGKQPIVVTSTILPLEDIEKQGKTSNINTFQGKRLSPTPTALEEGKQLVGKRKTAEIFISREEIEKQFGKTEKDAAKSLGVHLSTLKRKLKDHDIRWPAAKVNRNKKDLSSNKVNINEVDNGAIQKPLININEVDNGTIQKTSTFNTNGNSLTIKVVFEDDVIVIRRPILEGTFVTIQKEIGVKFGLSLGTYKIKYHEEGGDKILLTSNEDISYCIESSGKYNRNEVRLHVHLQNQYPQPISGPSCS